MSGSAFTRRHYRSLADSLAESLPQPRDFPDHETWTVANNQFWHDMEELARTLMRDNPRFDRERFIMAATRTGTPWPREGTRS